MLAYLGPVPMLAHLGAMLAHRGAMLGLCWSYVEGTLRNLC